MSPLPLTMPSPTLLLALDRLANDCAEDSAGAGASEGDNGRGGLSGDRTGGVSENGVQA